MEMYTLPSYDEIQTEVKHTPQRMYPNGQPYAVVFKSFLSDEECQLIIDTQSERESYQFPHCNAITTECDHPISEDLAPIKEMLRFANEACFQYDVDFDSTQAWMQTYVFGGSYQKHMDGAPGQTRKLTAVAMLTDPFDYKGGELMFDIPTNTFEVPNARGTVVVFPGWALHHVRSLTAGVRQTINMGAWGPAWR